MRESVMLIDPIIELPSPHPLLPGAMPERWKDGFSYNVGVHSSLLSAWVDWWEADNVPTVVYVVRNRWD